jgi:hypothetical protein
MSEDAGRAMKEGQRVNNAITFGVIAKAIICHIIRY